MEILEVVSAGTGEQVTVSLKGELDLSTVAKVEEELRRVESSDATLLVLDLSGLTFLDSTGLRAVITADERARAQGRRFVIVKGPDAVQRVFAITRLEERLEMVDDDSSLSDGST
jgi:anti-sigma B factor antagonist